MFASQPVLMCDCNSMIVSYVVGFITEAHSLMNGKRAPEVFQIILLYASTQVRIIITMIKINISFY